MRMCVKFIEWRDAFVKGVNAGTALFVPPLIATPNLPLNFIVSAFNIFLKYKRLSEVQKLSLATSSL